jgi:sulfoxide reductase heme-binding subunit YedZ
MVPWLDHPGRFSPFKTLVFALLFVPGIWTASDFAAGNLGPRPLNEAMHQIGLWAIRLIFLSLAVTPLRQSLRWQSLGLVRRMIGVAAFAYTAIHLFLYTADEMFHLGKVVSEIVARFYLTIGFIALVGLAALAATSTDGMVRRLGGRAWRRLHQTLYVLGVLAVVHFFLQSKLDIYEPLVMAGLYVWLMGYRLIARLGTANRRAPAATAVALAVAASILTAAGEAIYFWTSMGVDPFMVLAANLRFDIGLRPGWIVLAITLAVGVIASGREALQPAGKLGVRATSKASAS